MNSFGDTFNSYIIPLLGAVALVFVIALIFYLIKFVNKATDTLTRTDKTIDLVDTSIEKIQAPLNTVAKVSNTVEKAHDSTVKVVTGAKDFVNKNIEVLKERIINRDDEEEDEESDEE